MQGYSIGLNVLLVAVLAFVYLRAKAKAKEHKLATFAGCLAALTCGAMHDDPDTRMRMLALGFKPMMGDAELDEIKKQLIRASTLHMLRGTQNPSVFDVGGENTRLLIMQAGGGVGTSEETDKIWNYIEWVAEDKTNFRGELSDVFSEDALGRSQLYASSVLLDFYRTNLERLAPAPV